MGARYIGLVLNQRLEAQDFAREHERIARHEALDEIFLQFPEHAPAARDRARRTVTAGCLAARAHQPHLDHGFLHDGADIEPVLLRNARMADAVASVLALTDLGETLVDLERIAAGGDEIDHRVEIRPGEAGKRRGHAHLLEQRVGPERLAAGAAQYMLRQYVEGAGA